MAFSKLAKSFQLFELLLLKICFPSGIQPVWPAGDIIFQLLTFFIKETLSNNTIICQSWIKSLPSTKKTQKITKDGLNLAKVEQFHINLVTLESQPLFPEWMHSWLTGTDIQDTAEAINVSKDIIIAARLVWPDG